ncbi:MAG: SPOR domain-containing protein [Nitrospirota bacterium]|nr:SPOR domain-containing protein [Nitrospirota bacterium]
MRNSAFHKNSASLQLPGKEFIIVVVVIFSALSFTLGYFVGKSGIDGAQMNHPQAAETAPSPQTQGQDAFSRSGSLSAPEDAPGAEETAATDGEAQQKEPIVAAGAKQPAPAKPPEPVKDKPRAQTVAKQNVKESPDARKSSGSSSKEPVYSVQLGAFKSSAETKSFRKKYAIKGIKTFVSTSANKKKEKIYKVRTGEFRDRKDAELLSLKLNKTEDLKTFVTVRND